MDRRGGCVVEVAIITMVIMVVGGVEPFETVGVVVVFGLGICGGGGVDGGRVGEGVAVAGVET